MPKNTRKPVWTISQLEALKSAGKIRGYTEIRKTENKAVIETQGGKKGKYGNKKDTVNGITFDSKKEAKRYKELLLLQKAGEIGQLRLQVPYELNPGGTHSLKYLADFVYVDAKTGETIVEDVKGFRTREYKKKRRLMLKVHGITIKEF